MGIIESGYPKFIEHNDENILVKTEDEEMELLHKADKDRMVTELREMGKEVDMRSYKGSAGFGALKAYYEAVIAREGNNGDGGGGD